MLAGRLRGHILFVIPASPSHEFRKLCRLHAGLMRAQLLIWDRGSDATRNHLPASMQPDAVQVVADAGEPLHNRATVPRRRASATCGSDWTNRVCQIDRQHSPAFSPIESRIGGDKWGILYLTTPGSVVRLSDRRNTMIACYVRVSTIGQNEQGQRAEIERWLAGNGIVPA